MKTKNIIPETVPTKFRNILEKMIKNNCLEESLQDPYEHDLVYAEAILEAEQQIRNIQNKRRPVTFIDLRRIIKVIKRNAQIHIEILSGIANEAYMYV